MTYEYVCTACGHEWEAEQAISAAPLKKCPSCRKSRAKRQVSGGAGFILKGGGWYADGYGSAKPPAKPEGDTAVAAAKPDAGDKKPDAGEKKAETTPAATEKAAKPKKAKKDAA
jgi:putative FmdB family regulatory protein